MKESEAKPLKGIHVLDLGLGLPASIVTKLLVEYGATVVRLEPEHGDPFYEIHPAYRIWQQGKTIASYSPSVLKTELSRADICVAGGEDFPGVNWRHDLASFRAEYPALVILNLRAGPESGGDDFPAVELLAQAKSGLVFEHYSDRPAVTALPIGSYGAAFHGFAALLAALWARNLTGIGDIVTTSLVQGAIRWCDSIWFDAENTPPGFNGVFPKGIVPLRFRCADGKYINFAPGVDNFFPRLYALLGIEADPEDLAAADKNKLNNTDPSNYFGDMATISRYAEKWRRDDLLAAVQANDLPGEAVLLPGECWDDPQTIENGVIESNEDGWSHTARPVVVRSTGTLAAPLKVADVSAADAPLKGVRIIDFGSFAAGPHASVILGDLGADVIKVERLDGDPMRRGFHHFAASNRGKRSIAIDGKHPDGLTVIQRLCARADAVHHNFRPGVSKKLGIDAATLKAINPAIVVLESSAYGERGPKSMMPGFDSVFQGICGHQSVASGKGNPPGLYRFAPIDYGTGMLGAVGLMLGLTQRQRFNSGAEAHESLLNTGIYMISELVRQADGRFIGVPQTSADQLGVHPAESLYQTQDGWIAVAARSEAMAKQFAAAVHLRLENPRSAWGDTEYTALKARLRELSTTQALDALRAAGVWVAECQPGITAVLDDPAMEACGLVLRSQLKTIGHARQVGRAVNFASRKLPVEGRSYLPDIGEHTREILADHGFSSAEINDLVERGIVK